MFRTKPFLVLSGAALLLGFAAVACGPKPVPAVAGATIDGASLHETGADPYIAPPHVDGVQVDATGVTLSGSGEARSKARLGTPQGFGITGNVDKHGRWAIPIGPSADFRLYGLSTTLKDRTVQAEGYVLVTPRGQVALLRSGAGAIRIDPAARPGIRAIDLDRGGGVQITIAAPARTAVALRLDGRQVAQGRTDAAGRYGVDLPSSIAPEPIRPGAHRLQLYVDGTPDNVTFQLSPATPLAPGPMRGQFTPAGPRVDWMTPGGGVQSTILVH